MLEGGHRAVGVGEGGLHMGEDLRRCRPVRGLSRQFGRRAPPRQCRADLALAQVEPFPEALPGSDTEMAAGNADGCEYAAGDGTRKEPPQRAGAQAQPTDFVRAPDTESAPQPRRA